MPNPEGFNNLDDLKADVIPQSPEAMPELPDAASLEKQLKEAVKKAGGDVEVM